MNDDRKIVIIGCGAGGGTAAQFARKTDRKAAITLFEKGRYPQYSKCGLPYVISGKIPEFADLIEFSKDWFTKEHIDLYLETTVTAIDVKNQVVIAKKGSQRIEKEFDKLIIATGAKPSIPQIPGIHRDGELIRGTQVLRTIDNGEQISSYIKKEKNATIIGAGLIGLEMADSLHRRGMEVTVVELLPDILINSLDKDMSEIVHKEAIKKITIYTSHVAKRVEEKNGAIKQITIIDTKTNEVKTLDTDVLVIATGTVPDVSLAKSIGCTIGESGGIQVNGKSETSVENVYAVGDCTEYRDFVTKEPVVVGLGSVAVRQGIAAGINAAGGAYILPEGFLFTRTSRFFGIEVAAVGPCENVCRNLPVIYGRFKGSSLPGYYPGGRPITMKVGVDEETGVILSAQAVGSNAAQRVNVFACAVLNRMNVDDFNKLETAYAPSVAPTLDVLTLVGDVVSLKRARKRR